MSSHDVYVRWLVAGASILAVAGWAGVALAWPAALLLMGAIMVVGWSRNAIAIPLAVAFALRSTVASLHWMGLWLPDSTADAVAFHRQAVTFANGSAFPIPQGSALYSWVLSILYRVLAPDPYLGEALNVLLGIIIVWTGATIARELWGARIGVAAAWFMAAFPTLILYSVVLLREAIMMSVFMLAVLAVVRFWKTPTWKWALAALAGAVVPTWFHVGFQFISPAVVLVVAVRLLLPGAASGPRRVVFTGFLVPMYLALVFVGAASGMWLPADPDDAATSLESTGHEQRTGSEASPPSDGNATGSRNVTESDAWNPPGDAGHTEPSGNDSRGSSDVGTDLDAPGITKAQADRVSGRAAYPAWTVVAHWWQAIYLGPVRVAFLLLAPLPWMLSEATDALALFDAFIYVGILAGLWRGRRALAASSPALQVATITAIGIAVFAMGTSNYGTGIRHRAKFVPLLIAMLPPRAWEFRLPGRPHGTTLLSDIEAVTRRLNEWTGTR